jgi:hypothetical protein
MSFAAKKKEKCMRRKMLSNLTRAVAVVIVHAGLARGSMLGKSSSTAPPETQPPMVETQPQPNQPPRANPAKRAAQSVQYRNTSYGFSFSLPETWKGYQIVFRTWTDANAHDPDGDQLVQRGPLLTIQNPRSTDQSPLQNITIMVFTRAQWELLRKGDFVVAAGPIGPAELGRNRKYVFAEPPRDLNPDGPGYLEVIEIMKAKPLHPF